MRSSSIAARTRRNAAPGSSSCRTRVVARHAREQLVDVDLEPAFAPEREDALARRLESDLPALQAVPRVLAVVLVGAEHDGADPARIGADREPELLDRAERRIGEHAAEVEQEGLDAARHSFRFQNSGLVMP